MGKKSTKPEHTKSFRNKIWKLPDVVDLDLKKQIIRSRHGDIENFVCNVSIKNSMPDPYKLAKVEELISAIEKLSDCTIGIFGDYDADGITSTAMWKQCFDLAGISNIAYIPNRSDGYGASTIGIDFLLSKNCKMILFLDCGTNSKEMLDKLDVTIGILDHHHTNEMPEKAILVNPYRNDYSDQDPYKILCTAGLSFLALIVFAKKFNIDSAFILSLLDLAAIGTLGDVMPLQGINRAIVKNGLKLINSNKRKSIQVLCDVMQLKRPIISSYIAFYLVPCINAAGRISDATIALKLLLSEDEEECQYLCATLRALNEQRKSIEDITTRQALLQIDPEKSFISVKHHEWHAGVVGVVAGQLKENFAKTSFVFYKHENLWKGSARGHNQNVGELIHKSVVLNLAESGGGHAAAGGIAVLETKFDEWENWTNEQILLIGTQDEVIEIDGVISETGLKSIADLTELGPFGPANPSPRLILKNVWLKNVTEFNNHLRCTLNSGRSFFAFKSANSWGQNFKNGRYYDFILSVDEVGNVKIDDARFAEN
jgi:single-stranded-DNA-specific exonuclease